MAIEEKIVVTSEIAVTLKEMGGKWKPLNLELLRTEGNKTLFRDTEIYRRCS